MMGKPKTHRGAHDAGKISTPSLDCGGLAAFHGRGLPAALTGSKLPAARGGRRGRRRPLRRIRRSRCWRRARVRRRRRRARVGDRRRRGGGRCLRRRLRLGLRHWRRGRRRDARCRRRNSSLGRRHRPGRIECDRISKLIHRLQRWRLRTMQRTGIPGLRAVLERLVDHDVLRAQRRAESAAGFIDLRERDSLRRREVDVRLPRSLRLHETRPDRHRSLRRLTIRSASCHRIRPTSASACAE